MHSIRTNIEFSISWTGGWELMWELIAPPRPVQFSSVVFYLVPPFREHLCTWVRHSCHGLRMMLVGIWLGLYWVLFSSIIIFKVQFSVLNYIQSSVLNNRVKLPIKGCTFRA